MHCPAKMDFFPHFSSFCVTRLSSFFLVILFFCCCIIFAKLFVKVSWNTFFLLCKLWWSSCGCGYCSFDGISSVQQQHTFYYPTTLYESKFLSKLNHNTKKNSQKVVHKATSSPKQKLKPGKHEK